MTDTDIAELERRISAAMGRIGQVIEGMAGSDGVPRSDFETALDETEAARREAAEMRRRAETAEAEVVRLREALDAESTANDQLRDRNAALKSAKETAQARAEALERDTEEMSEARAADRAELDALIGALEPLVREHPHA